MKKWFIALVALVMIPATALAVKHNGDIITHYCPKCKADRECELAGDIYEGFVDENGHVFAFTCNTCGYEGSSGRESHYGGNPTCERAAECAGCGASYTLAHTWVAANCQAPRTCSVCCLIEGIKDPDNHNWGDWTKLNDDYHSRACQNSGCTQTQSERHTEKSPANCTPAAWCNDCNQAYGVPNPDNHGWGNWIYKNENQHYRICVHDNLHIQHADHRGYATCIYSMPCQDCDHHYKNPDNHQGPYTYAYASSASSATLHTVTETCTGCRKTSRKYDEAHDIVRHAPQAPTCKAEGWRSYETCKHCAYSTYSAIDPDSNAHNLVQHDAKAPTCTEKGWDAYQTCTRCTYSTYVEKKPLKHKLAYHSGRTPTCTIIGWDPYYACLRCDYSTYAVKRALGHDPVNHSAKAPTCTEIGWDAYDTCSRCDYTTYVEKKALGHDLVNHAAKALTCTEIGWDAYDTCSRCDYTTYVEKKALGHDPVNHAAKAPTCTTIGWNAYDTCSRCDYTTYAELAALGHDYAAKTTKSTCTEKGYTTHTCTRCQDSYRDGFVSALGHRYGAWVANADGTNSSACLRGCGDVRTADCAPFVYALPAGDVRMEFVLCPVCGEIREIRLLDADGELVETLDGAVLLPVEDATAEAVNKRQPAGEAIVRMGALESGDTLLSVAFENDGKLTQPTGQVSISLPAEALEGHTLALILEDGTETELTLEVQEKEASFVLDFTDSLCPVQVIRLVPEV